MQLPEGDPRILTDVTVSHVAWRTLDVNGHTQRSHRIEASRSMTTESRVSPTPEQADDEQYVVGVDFGTLSGRALVVRVSDGAELGTATYDYPHGVMDTVLASSGATLPA